MIRKTVIAVLAALLWMSPGMVRATMVLPLDLKAMTEQSEKIFVGRCLGSEASLDENHFPSTVVKFQASQGIKGVSDGEAVVIKQFGAVKGPLQAPEGESIVVPMKTMTLANGGYRPGQDYLLFLYPESSLGFTSPVGAGQGLFEISAAGLAVNPIDNRNLSFVRGGPIRLDSLIRRVRGYLP